MSVMVSFTAASVPWLVPVDSVLGIRSLDDIRALPSPDRAVLGVIDHDGRACPVIDPLDATGDQVVMVLHDEQMVGLRTDEVTGVIEHDPDSFSPRPAGQDRDLVAATHGTGSELAYVLDVVELVRPLLADVGSRDG